MIGKVVTHYKILDKLGEGGMGLVYKALDIKLDRYVALKFLPSYLSRDDDDKNRFIREAQAASSLDHPNICTIHEIDQTDDNQLFVAMSYYDGKTLKEKILSGPLSIAECINIGLQISKGLSKAHEKGITHRDIKPSNIFVTAEGNVKIIDFGLAKLTGRTSITKEGTTLGTVNYMSPEQAKGSKVNHRTDIWSFGVVLYEIITGQKPFSADYDQAVLYGIINQEPEAVSTIRKDVPVELESIINKCLEKNPDKRYQNMDDIVGELSVLNIKSEFSASAKKLSGTWANRSTLTRALPYAAVLIIAAVAFVFLKLYILSETTAVSEPRPIAVIAFVNQTGDPAYDYLREAIPNLLITNLEQYKYLRVMTWERMKDVLKQMGKGNENFINNELGFELCRREGINTIVVGSFVKGGNIFATDVKVLDVGTMELLKTASSKGEGVQSILKDQIDRLSEQIAGGIGLAKRNVEETPSQISQVTTSSMDAYNFFLRGRQDYDKLYFTEAKRFLEKAVSLDSNFAMAYLYLSNTYADLIEIPQMRETLLKAKALSSRAPEKERLIIESRYAAAIEKNHEKSFQLLQELVKKYPQEKRFHNELGQQYHLAGKIPEAKAEFEKAINLDPEYATPINGLAYIYAEQGLYVQAIQILKKYAALSPGDANPFDSMAEMYFRMGNLKESLAKYKDAIRAQPTFYPAYSSLAYVYALNENYIQSLNWIDSLLNAAPTAGLKANARSWRACYFDLTGRHREYLNEMDLMAGLVKQMGTRDPFAYFHWRKAWYALDNSNTEEALSEFKSYREIFVNSNPQIPNFHKAIHSFFLAQYNLHKNRVDSARAYFEIMKSSLASVEWYRDILKMMSGVLESELLLAEEKPDDAIKVYRNTSVVIPVLYASWQMPLYNTPYLRDVVPRAFLFKGELDSAVREYEKLIKIDPGSKDRRFIHPLFHYRLAKLYEKTGKLNNASNEYKKFLELWKYADNNLPEPVDAKKRLAYLSNKI